MGMVLFTLANAQMDDEPTAHTTTVSIEGGQCVVPPCEMMGCVTSTTNLDANGCQLCDCPNPNAQNNADEQSNSDGPSNSSPSLYNFRWITTHFLVLLFHVAFLIITNL